MKLAIVHGNARHGSTWHFALLFVEALKKRCELEVTEFSLPRDLPDLCVGCFNCFVKGEHTCPHAAKVSPIAEATEQADMILLTSPVYALDVTGGMKTLLDHLCYRWMVHRPDPRMFGKVGVTVSTTAGAGTGNASKTMRNSLRFWGVKHVFSLKMPVAAIEWNGVPEKTKAKMQKNAENMADRALRAKGWPLGFPLRRVVFLAVRTAMKKSGWNERDLIYWKEKGWLDGVNPFRTMKA